MHEHIITPGQSHRPTYCRFSSLENLFPSKTSAVVQPMPVLPVGRTNEKETLSLKHISISPVLPGTGSITHNVTRMLSEASDTGRCEGQSTSMTARVPRFSPYSTSHFLSYRQSMSQENTSKRYDKDLVDVVAEGDEQQRNADASMTDSLMLTQGSASPQSSTSASSPSGSSRSSPGSDTGAATSPETTDEDRKKKKLVRTSYTNEQIQTLLKIFHENPYPDSEHMEDIAKEFGVPDNKIKIWFQNKRARWRRRVNDTMNSYPHGFLPITPALSHAHPNGYMTSGHFMAASTPQHMAAGYFNPWLQTNSLRPNNNNVNQFPVNPAQLRLSPTSTFTSDWSPTQSYQPVPVTPATVSAYSSTPTAYQMRTSPQQAMRSQFPSMTISPNSSSYLSSALLSHPMTSPNQMTTSQVKTPYQ